MDTLTTSFPQPRRPPRRAADWALTALLFAAFALAASRMAWADTPGAIWAATARETAARLDEALSAAEAGHRERAADLVSEVYFGVFEERGMEIAVRQQLSARRAWELERMFSAVRGAIVGGEPSERVRHLVGELHEALTVDGRELDRLGVQRPDLAERREAQAGPEGDVPGRAPSDAALAPIVRVLDESLARYRAGEPVVARSALDRGYFDGFEGSGLEAAVGARWPGRKAAIEAGFARARRLIGAAAPAEEVAREIEALKVALADALARLAHPATPWATFLNGLVIIVREGFEAILVITALTAYLVKLGHPQQVRVVYQACAAAVLASVATAVALQTLVQVTPRHREALEGATMLLAAAVLFAVSWWLTARASAERWQEYLRARVRASLGTRSLLTLWSTTFLAVYREGAETALFYQALLSATDTQSGGAALAGLGVGALALAGLFLGLRAGAVRIPVRAFFTGTSVMLYALAVVFAGQGVRELQAAGLVGATPVRWVPAWEAIGLHPTWEGLALQLLLLGAAAAAAGRLVLRRGRRRRVEVAGG